MLEAFLITSQAHKMEDITSRMPSIVGKREQASCTNQIELAWFGSKIL